MPKTITITLPDAELPRFINAINRDAGTLPTTETLVANWVNDNIDRKGSMNPADWVTPSAASAPDRATLLAAWRQARRRRAFDAVRQFVEDAIDANERRLALAGAETQIAETIRVARVAARRETAVDAD